MGSSALHGALKQLERETGMEDDEDEETLQLQLQAIEAKLKLKRLRQTKAKSATADSEMEKVDVGSISKSIVSARDGERASTRAKSQLDVQVPVSPPERKRTVQEARSPGRVLLGIDKGLTGRDVSLRRAPSLRNDGNKRSNTGSQQTTSRMTLQDGADRPKTFSERIAEIRAEDKSRKEREERIRRTRSKGFGIPEKELEGYKKAANETQMDEDPFMAEARRGEVRKYTREEILQSYNQPQRGLLRKSKTTPDLTLERTSGKSGVGKTVDARYTRDPARHVQHRATRDSSNDGDPNVSSTDTSQFEAFSGFQLSKRILSHNLLTRTFSGKKIFQMPDLLKTIKSPNYDTPDIEEDWVLLGIIASKSSPRDHKDNHNSTGDGGGRGKYMVLSLTDLKWELELFLFSTAFDRYWKLSPGTVIAILNPSIMPPLPAKRDTGRFSLTLNSSDETVLEIGTARDLGFCKSVKRDGSLCNSWIDRRHTEFCDYHIDITLRKTKAGRMEVNTMTAASFGPGGAAAHPSASSRGGFFRGMGRSASSRGTNDHGGLQRDSNAPYHDRATHSQIYISAGAAAAGRSTANLLDDEDVDPDAFHRGYSKEERLRRHLVEQQREREIAKQLGATVGGGMGATYLRAATATTASHNKDGVEHAPQSTSSLSSSTDPTRTADLKKDILRPPASYRDDVRLSPVKRKRSETSGSAEPMGWAGATSRKGGGGLGMISPTKKSEDIIPLRKKTRFVTSKGIREAGRESLGIVGGGIGRVEDDEDDDDGLEIV